jgi:hypothetical protein
MEVDSWGSIYGANGGCQVFMRYTVDNSRVREPVLCNQTRAIQCLCHEPAKKSSLRRSSNSIRLRTYDSNGPSHATAVTPNPIFS